MYTDLQPISSSSATNFGGICYFEFIAREWLVDEITPNITTRIVDAAPALISGKDWLRADCLIDSLQYTEKQMPSDAGSFFQGELIGTILFDTLDNNNLINTIRYHELVVKYYDRNNICKIIGSMNVGMRFSAVLNTGSKPIEVNQFNFSLDIQLEQRAPLYIV